MSNDLKYYKTLYYKMIWDYDPEDKVYYVRFPELPGCLAHGKTEQEALETALAVKDEWLQAAYESGWKIPEPSVAMETTGRVTLRLPKYLHKKVIDRAEEEGVSQNQLIVAFIAQSMEKATAEESFDKITKKQDDIISLLSEDKKIPGFETISANSAMINWLDICTSYDAGPSVYLSSAVTVAGNWSSAAINNFSFGSEEEENKQKMKPKLQIVRSQLSAVG